MTFRGVIGACEGAGRFVENALLIVLLGLMIVLASAQIVCRNILDISFVWGDELLRLLVLWVAMVGAVAASRADRHITIDVLSRFLPERANHATKFVTDLFTACVSGIAAWYSWQFVAMEMEFQSTVLGDLPAWAFQVILPAGFGLIAWRYLLHGFRSLAGALGHESGEEEA